MAVNVVLVDLEFCTKSECVSVRFPRNFVRKISVNTNSTPTISWIFSIDFESDNFTHPTRFCLALARIYHINNLPVWWSGACEVSPF